MGRRSLECDIAGRDLRSEVLAMVYESLGERERESEGEKGREKESLRERERERERKIKRTLKCSHYLPSVALSLLQSRVSLSHSLDPTQETQRGFARE